eukprot:scaffold129762_cov43-Attheya_sp.AAC.2
MESDDREPVFTFDVSGSSYGVSIRYSNTDHGSSGTCSCSFLDLDLPLDSKAARNEYMLFIWIWVCHSNVPSAPPTFNSSI